jgi:hypothetical protein
MAPPSDSMSVRKSAIAASVAARVSSKPVTSTSMVASRPVMANDAQVRSFCSWVTMPVGPVAELANRVSSRTRFTSFAMSRTSNAVSTSSGKRGAANEATSFARIGTRRMTISHQPRPEHARIPGQPPGPTHPRRQPFARRRI